MDTTEGNNDETPYQRLKREREEARAEGQTEETKSPLRHWYPPEVRKARAQERNRRTMESRRRANLILQQRHASEFTKLLEIESAGLDAERGPMPGDEPQDQPGPDLERESRRRANEILQRDEPEQEAVVYLNTTTKTWHNDPECWAAKRTRYLQKTSGNGSNILNGKPCRYCV